MSEGHYADVTIVGAGPSGSAAAYDLLKKGFSVQLLDKAAFPRVKPCAGGITIKTLNALRFSIEPVVQRQCFHFDVGYRLQPSKRLFGSSPIAVMTVRSQFDSFCLQKCLDLGGRLTLIDPIKQIGKTNGLWNLTAGTQQFASRFLIGADGANSRVRKLARPDLEVRFGMAVEACVPHNKPNEFEMEMDFGIVPSGYGWIFPKGDHLNVGLYSLQQFKGMKSKLVEFCRQRLQVDLDPRHVIGHRIPFNGHQFHHLPDSPILVGDAAGLIDPVLGEGLYNAVRSGQIAAEAIAQMAIGKTDPYDLLIGEIRNDLSSYWFYTQFFYRRVRRGTGFLQRFPFRYVAMKGYALGWTIRKIKNRLPLLPFCRPRLLGDNLAPNTIKKAG